MLLENIQENNQYSFYQTSDKKTFTSLSKR